MKRLLKNIKGMSLLEVMIALAVLGLLSVPIMTAFMNTQIYARKVDKQTEVSAITRTVKQIVCDGIINAVDEMIMVNNSNVQQFVGPGHNDTFRDFLNYAIDNPGLVQTPYLQIKENGTSVNSKYKYKISYDHSDVQYYDAQYPNVFNLKIEIFDAKNDQLLNKIKVTVKLDG